MSARILRLPVVPVLLVALLAGLVGTAHSLVGGPWAGVVGGLVAFGASCGRIGRSVPAARRHPALDNLER